MIVGSVLFLGYRNIMVMFGRTEEGADMVVAVFGNLIREFLTFLVSTDARLIFMTVIKVSTLATEFQLVFLSIRDTLF